MPLVTRQYGPNAKNTKLSNFDMDSNLYYLQELGVSGFSYSNGIIEISNPTGGTKDVTINIVTGFTYDNLNTFTITDNYNNNFSATINTVTGLTVNGTISATTYDNLPPAVFSGGTVTGPTTFTNGLTATTISATTYDNLPQDIYVTGGTYTNGEILFKNNSGGNFTVTGLPIGGAGGEIYYFNLSQTQTPYQEFSPIGTSLTEQTTGVTINSGVTSTIASFLTPLGYPNATTIPAGYWSFYIHTYKDVINASFDVFCEVYVYTTGGTETLILTTEGADVPTYAPTISMQLTDGYYSGGTIDITDRILVKVRTTNNGSQTNTLSFFTEGQQHYSYGITPFSNFNALTCETLSGCTTILNLENNKVNKSGDTMTGTLNVPTISATTYLNVPSFVNMVFAHSSLGPADATTYHIGALSNLTPSTSNRDAWTVNSQYTGNITEVSIISNFGGGSSENSTITLHNLSASTSQVVTSALQYVSGTPVQILFEPLSASTIPVGWSSSLVVFNGPAASYAGFTALTSTLTSVVFDGAAYASINVQTDVARFGGSLGVPATDGPILVEYSLNGGSTWTTAGVTSTPTSTSYLTSTVSVPATSSQMAIRFSVSPLGNYGKRLRNVYFNGLSSSINNNYVLGTPLAVTSGDKLQIRWTTPTWVTNPSGVTNLFNLKLRL